MTMNETMTVEIEAMRNGMWRRAALGVALALGVAACGDAQADGTEDEQASAEFARVINVETSEVVPQAFVEQIRLTGVAWANQDVQVSAEESGVVRELLVEKGQSVQEGQPLVRIDDAVLRAQVAQARAQAELAAQTWERRKRLYEEDQVGSELAYLEAKFAAEQTRANLDGLEARLERTTIRAPFAGVLDQRMVEVGTLVSPGQAVARIVDATPVKIVAGVPERYAADVRRGGAAVVFFDVLPGEQFPANIDFVGTTVNPQNRTFPIEIRMPNPGGLIKPGMVSNILVRRRNLEQAVVVPQDALVRVEEGYVVFVAGQDENGNAVARVRRVTLGPAQNNEVVVEDGLEGGEQLIVVGHKSVADGDRINVVGS